MGITAFGAYYRLSTNDSILSFPLFFHFSPSTLRSSAILISMKNSFKLAPSILSADFTQLGRDLKEIEAAGADLVHIDVMDGRFVPNITIGPMVTRACARASNLPLDVHLMIVEPERYIAEFAKAGAAYISIHAEATTHLHRSLQLIKDVDVGAALAVNPLTPLNIVLEALPYLDKVLIMSVNPGFGGQEFIKTSLPRIETVANWISDLGLACEIEVDGGINTGNIKELVSAGANVIVAGSAVFNQRPVSQNIAELRQAVS